MLDVQTDLLDTLATRAVVPLIAASAMEKAVKHLNPEFTIRKTKVFMSTAELAGIPIRTTGEKVGSLKAQRTRSLLRLIFYSPVSKRSAPIASPQVIH